MDKFDQLLILDWLQYSNRFNEERATLTLRYISELREKNKRYEEVLYLIANKERDEDNWNASQLITALRHCKHEALFVLNEFNE